MGKDNVTKLVEAHLPVFELAVLLNNLFIHLLHAVLRAEGAHILDGDVWILIGVDGVEDGLLPAGELGDFGSVGIDLLFGVGDLEEKLLKATNNFFHGWNKQIIKI